MKFLKKVLRCVRSTDKDGRHDLGKKAVSVVGEGSEEGMRTFGPGLAGQWLGGQESEMPGRGNFFVWTGTGLGKLKKDLGLASRGVWLSHGGTTW